VGPAALIGYALYASRDEKLDPGTVFANCLSLVFFKLLDRPRHLIARIGRVVPALDLHPLAFKILVDREESA
jgi:hypothetical protein